MTTESTWTNTMITGIVRGDVSSTVKIQCTFTAGSDNSIKVNPVKDFPAFGSPQQVTKNLAGLLGTLRVKYGSPAPTGSMVCPIYRSDGVTLLATATLTASGEIPLNDGQFTQICEGIVIGPFTGNTQAGAVATVEFLVTQ